ncbi:NAD(P)/FAD-dependent oxidoreductase [Paracoccus pacificus]|uniref:NAD(P)/FAD-dependent oxidoreductase n=1 Tax=Paracoccus pacificus TaxID=1463598 RepID=A0ABW4RBR2_9RHOB
MNLLYANDRKGEYPPSLYAATRTMQAPFAAVRGKNIAQVCVIGGGYTGLSAALHLARLGISTRLVEAHRVGFGASGRNGGQIGSGQRLDVDQLEDLAGKQAAQRLWNMAEEAKALVAELAGLAAVPVHPGVAHACRTEAEVAHSHKLAEKLDRDYGYKKIRTLDRDAFRALVPSDAYVGGDLDLGAGHLHPLNFAIGLAQLATEAGAHIHENSAVHHIRHARRPGEKTIVQTDHGFIECDHVILGCNGYMGQHLSAEVAARVMPINNYIVATAPLGDRADEVLRQNIAVHDTKFVVNYWRLSPDKRLIFGGGETVTYRFPADIAAKVRKPMQEIYPGLRGVDIDYAWGGTLAITFNRMPLFARPAPDTISASGFSGHGVALATLAGKLMAQAVAGNAAGFDAMAALAPRRFPGGGMLRWPYLVAGMSWYSLRDRLGF